MPSKGINFGVPKRRTAQLSQNPRTTANRTWEGGLSGLTLALYRTDKAATVGRTRAIKALKSSAEWSILTVEEQNLRIQAAVDEVNRKRDIKKETAKELWMEIHGDGDEADKEGDDMTENLMSEEDEEIPSMESFENKFEEREESEEAEEVEESSDDQEGEFTNEEAKHLHSRLLELRTQQRKEAEEFIQSVEAFGETRKGKEIPDDYEIGG